MADNKLPNWKETRDRILSQGIKIADLEQKVTDYKAKFGAIFATDDLLYYVLAQKEFGLSMPTFTTLGQKTGGPSIPVGLHEVGFDTPASSVSTVAYVAALDIVDGKKGDNVKATLIDANARRELRCYFPEIVGDVLQTVQVGKTYKFDNLGLFKRKEQNGYPADALLTWGDRTTAEEVQQNVFVNMREKALKDGQPCMYEGYVTDEETRTYQGCSKCKKSIKKTPVCTGASATDIELYSATITDGTGKFTISFGSRKPAESLHHSVVQVVGIYKQDRNEISVIRHQQIEKNAIPKHQDVMSGKAATAAPVKTTSGTTIRNVTPDEVLINVVQKYGVSPKQAVVYKLTRDCNMTPADADKFIQTKVGDGTITLAGETVKWIKA